MENNLLSIIIPVYNEEKSIITVLNTINKINLIYKINKEIIVINDCSTDKTEDLILDYIRNNQSNIIKYYKQHKNLGKGAALRKGFKVANGEFIIIQDADTEYDPEEFNVLLKPMINKYADVVYGSRFIGGKPHRILFFWHSIGNKFLTRLLNLFTNLNLTDMESCYKLFRADILNKILLVENRFGFEVEVTAKISRIPNIRIYEVGISYYGRTYREGKKINWKDGCRALYCIFKYGLIKL